MTISQSLRAMSTRLKGGTYAWRSQARRIIAVAASVATLATMVVVGPENASAAEQKPQSQPTTTAQPTTKAAAVRAAVNPSNTADLHLNVLGSVSFVGSSSNKPVEGATEKYNHNMWYTVEELNYDGSVKDQDNTFSNSSKVVGDNESDGSVSFTQPNGEQIRFTFKASDLKETPTGDTYKQSRVFNYQVKQSWSPFAKQDVKDELTLDTTVHKFSITLKNNNDGTMSVWYEGKKLEQQDEHNVKPVSVFSFTNTVKEAAPTPTAKAVRTAVMGGVKFTGDQSGKDYSLSSDYDRTLQITLYQTNNTDEPTIDQDGNKYLRGWNYQGQVHFLVNDGDAPITFKPEYLDGKKEKTFTYTAEQGWWSAEIPGVKLDETTKTFSLTVKDNGDGTLSVYDAYLGIKLPTSTDGSAVTPMLPSFTFKNKVTEPAHDVKAPILGSVVFNGDVSGVPVDGAVKKYAGLLKYTVEELNSDGSVKDQDNSLGWGGDGKAYGVNEADGSVSFVQSNGDPYWFNFQPRDLRSADGTYGESRDFTYRVTQSVLNADVPLDKAVSLDSKTYEFTLTLKNNGDGTMSVWFGDEKLATSGEESKPVESLFTFTNTIKAAAAQAVPAVSVTLSGREAKAGEFSFELRDADGRIVSTARNAADGSVRFGALVFDRPGTAAYTLVQKAGEAGGVVYDSTVYAVKFVVTDDLEGALHAVVSYAKGGVSADAAVFANAYKAAVKPAQKPAAKPTTPAVKPATAAPTTKSKKKLSATGTSVVAVELLAVVLAAAAGVTFVARRRSDR